MVKARQKNLKYKDLTPGGKKSFSLWPGPILALVFLGLALVFGPHQPPGGQVVDLAQYRENGRTYRVTIEGRGEEKRWQGRGILAGRALNHVFYLGKEVVIYEKEEPGGRWQEKKRYDFEGVGPWSLALGQMDDKPDIEVFIGAYRATRYFPEGPRPYIFSWDFEKQELVRLWTGSYLGAPIFLQADMVDRDGDGYMEIKVREVDWQGGQERHYETYYTYLRRHFQPIRVYRQEIPAKTRQ